MKALSVLVLRYKQPGGARMEGAAEFPHREDGDPAGPDDDHGGAVRAGHHQRAHQEGGHHLRRDLHHRLLHRVRAVGHLQPQAQGRRTRRRWRSSAWTRARIFPRTPSACGRATCWWRCAIPTACSTWSASCARPTRASMDIVVLSVRQVTQAASGEHALDTDQIFSDDETDGLHARGDAGGKGRQARGADGGARHRPVRSRGADGRAAAIVAHRDGPFAQAHAFRAGRAGGRLLGATSRAAAFALARNRARKPEGHGLLQPGPASSAPLAGGHRPGAPALAGAERPRARARSCITATSSAWPCAA